jgi:superoxide oxidase
MEDSETLRPARGEARRDRYDPLSQALHWATVALVLATFALALWPELAKGSASLHKSLGLALFFAVLLRLGWRLTGGTGGGRPDGDGDALTLAAKAVHGALYAALLAVPLLGWLHLNSKGIGVSMFGLSMPTLADPDRDLARLLFQVKRWFAYGMLSAIGFHATAALAHHYVFRDGVLASMLPGGSRGKVAAADAAADEVEDAAGAKGTA